MREEFMITRQGKQYVLFAGLLDEAHSEGLKRVETQLVQIPEEVNGNVAIVKARAHMPPEEDGEPRFFDGIGDASPENVGRNIAPHLIRMAETRAKARALRDAVNVGATSLEELSDSGDAPTPKNRPQAAQTGNEKPKAAEKSNVSELKGKATNAPKRPPNAAKKAQRELIWEMVVEIWPDAADKALGKILDNLEVDTLEQITQDQAAEILAWLKTKLSNTEEAEGPEDEVEDFDEDEVEG